MDVPSPASWSILGPLRAQDMDELERSFSGRNPAAVAAPHLPLLRWAQLGSAGPGLPTPERPGGSGLTQWLFSPWPLAGRAITRHSAISCPVSSFLGLQFLLYLSKMNRDEVKCISLSLPSPLPPPLFSSWAFPSPSTPHQLLCLFSLLLMIS